mmetsp:Transcript_64882/g.146331  ORF Transcript_64882/g.146331 Transcript_64882/m.146331 type:complete len:246 (+) Transcript_64882:3-740(+)
MAQGPQTGRPTRACPELLPLAMFCRSVCRPGDPTTDSVRVNMSSIEFQTFQTNEAFTEAEVIGAEEEKAAREREKELRAQEEERQRHEEEERQRQEEEGQAEEKIRREEQARLEEQAQRRQEQLECQEQEMREEADRQMRLEDERDRKMALEAFCRQHGFVDINTPRRSGCAAWSATTTYALHCAAELADESIVEMLLKEGVDASILNSANKTAAQVAKKKDKSASHTGVRRLLGDVRAPRSGGA